MRNDRQTWTFSSNLDLKLRDWLEWNKRICIFLLPNEITVEFKVWNSKWKYECDGSWSKETFVDVYSGNKTREENYGEIDFIENQKDF